MPRAFSARTFATRDHARASDLADLRSLQAPIKERYRAAPESALVTLKAEGRLGEGVSCSVATGKALVACAGVTLSAVATSMGIPIQSGKLRAEGDLDFRGTLGVSKDAPVGFKSIRLEVALESTAPAEQLDKLLELTERYCVVLQTLKAAVPVRVTYRP